jgi:hypothetical protein
MQLRTNISEEPAASIFRGWESFSLLTVSLKLYGFTSKTQEFKFTPVRTSSASLQAAGVFSVLWFKVCTDPGGGGWQMTHLCRGLQLLYVKNHFYFFKSSITVSLLCL